MVRYAASIENQNSGGAEQVLKDAILIFGNEVIEDCKVWPTDEVPARFPRWDFQPRGAWMLPG
jgi:hypothetical protein